MKRHTQFAIERALIQKRDPQLIWRDIAHRVGSQEAQRISDYLSDKVRNDEVIDSDAPSSEEWRWALRALLSWDTVGDWRNLGFPMVVIPDLSVALELANTDPPSWLVTSPVGDGPWTALGLEIGDVEAIAVIGDWREGKATWIGQDISEEAYGHSRKRVPFDPEQERRLIANVGFALQERPEGLDIREHRPSPKAKKKQGMKHYPSFQYIIQAPRLVHPPEPQSELGPRPVGCTLSFRTLVRGHWRNQAHGPGHSLRKTIWIRPTWRGPEDAPVSIHPLKLLGQQAQAIAR